LVAAAVVEDLNSVSFQLQAMIAKSTAGDNQ